MTSEGRGFKGLLVRILAVGALCLAGLTLLTGVAWVALDPYNDLLALLAGTGLIATGAIGACALAAGVAGRGRLRIPMLLGAMGTLLGAALLICAICLDYNGSWNQSEDCLRYAWIILLPSLTIIHNGGLCLVSTRGMLRGMRAMAMSCAWVFTACVVAMILFNDSYFWNHLWGGVLFEMVVWPLTVISLLLTAVGTVVVPLAAAGGVIRKEHKEAAVHGAIAIDMECPKCRQRQNFKAGPARCSSCRVRLFIEVDEPRCECGYLLYRLVGDTCPECGRPVAAGQKWGEVEAAG